MRPPEARGSAWLRDVLMDIYGLLLSRNLAVAARHVMDAVSALEQATEAEIAHRFHAQEVHICWALHVVAEQVRDLGWRDVADHLDKAVSLTEAHLARDDRTNIIRFPSDKD